MNSDAVQRRAERVAQLGAHPEDWVPNPGPQTAFMSSTASECLFGGAAGGSKTEALIVLPLSRVHLPRYHGMVFRRQWQQAQRTLLPRMEQLYPKAGGWWVSGRKTWFFESGAKIEIGYADKEKDVERFAGTEFTDICIDEATHLTPWQYNFLRSRLRTTIPGVRPRLRAATNPGGPSHDFFLRRFAAWLYPIGEAGSGYHGIRARSGQVVWFVPIADSDEERVVAAETDGAMSRTFIGARLSDTPQLVSDRDYVGKLNSLSRLERKRLLGGDWMAREAAGEYFRRGWFEIVDAAPADPLYRVRYWDLAATPEKKATPSSAWTSGLLLSLARDGVMYVEHVVRGQWSPGEVERTIAITAEMDECENPATVTIIERDPGQAGKSQAAHFGKEFGIRAIPPQGDKPTRAQRPSAEAEVGNMKLVRGSWNEPFMVEAEAFPELTKDQIDSLSGATRLALIKRQQDRARRGFGGQRAAIERRRQRAE